MEYGHVNQLDNQKINELALEFATNGGEEVFTDLFAEMKPLVTNEARKETFKAAQYGLTIPVKDFESAFSMAVWTAAKEFNGQSNFIQRFYYFLQKRYRPNVWRQYRVRGNNEDKDGIRYDKARNDSLDRLINNKEETIKTLGDTLASQTDIEDIITTSKTVKQVMREFHEVKPQYSEIIGLVYQGFTTAEMAAILGERESNVKFRKRVSRAKKIFKRT